MRILVAVLLGLCSNVVLAAGPVAGLFGVNLGERIEAFPPCPMREVGSLLEVKERCVPTDAIILGGADAEWGGRKHQIRLPNPPEWFAGMEVWTIDGVVHGIEVQTLGPMHYGKDYQGKVFDALKNKFGAPIFSDTAKFSNAYGASFRAKSYHWQNLKDADMWYFGSVGNPMLGVINLESKIKKAKMREWQKNKDAASLKP